MRVSRQVRNWALLAALVAMWGSAFMFVKLSVASVPPATVVAARLVIGTVVLYLFMRARGLVLPAFNRQWLPFAVMALAGNCLPFYLITWGQQFIDSALAGILMAVMPLATMLLAHWFVAGERMTWQRVIGYLLGFAGIVAMMGPAGLAGLAGADRAIAAQAAVLGGALCYAVNSVLARRWVLDDFVVASTAVMLVASAMMLPVAIALDAPHALAPQWGSVASIVWLGLGPTALATVVYFKLIAAAGPTFMSIVNYLSPIVALLAGVALLGEHPAPSAVAGLVLVLVGIAISRRA